MKQRYLYLAFLLIAIGIVFLYKPWIPEKYRVQNYCDRTVGCAFSGSDCVNNYHIDLGDGWIIPNNYRCTCDPLDERCVVTIYGFTMPYYQIDNCKGFSRCIFGNVTKITDGDTLEIDNISVRLSLVDAPEYYEPKGNTTTLYLQRLCPIGSRALVDEDDGQNESYGRIVAVVYCNNTNINSNLINFGYASVDKYFCNVSEFAGEDWTGC